MSEEFESLSDYWKKLAIERGDEIQRRNELLAESLKHLDKAYKWGLWLYESEEYQGMEDEDEKLNMKDDLDIVCDFLNKELK